VARHVEVNGGGHVDLDHELDALTDADTLIVSFAPSTRA
jgi:hypothetical protein